jgi:hypothetical protein
MPTARHIRGGEALMIYQQDFEPSITTTLRPEDGTQQACATFTYDSEKPLVITASFPCVQSTHHRALDGYETLEWVIGRDLLLEAFYFPGKLAGERDVKLLDDTGTNTVVLFLDSPEGTAAIRFMRGDVEKFLNAMVEMVSPEDIQATVERELETFLSSLITEE